MPILTTRNPLTSSIISTVKKNFAKQLQAEGTVEGKIVRITGTGPYNIDVQPVFPGTVNELVVSSISGLTIDSHVPYPVIGGLDLDGNNLLGPPQLNDTVRIGFLNNSIGYPYIEGYIIIPR